MASDVVDVTGTVAQCLASYVRGLGNIESIFDRPAPARAEVVVYNLVTSDSTTETHDATGTSGDRWHVPLAHAWACRLTDVDDVGPEPVVVPPPGRRPITFTD